MELPELQAEPDGGHAGAARAGAGGDVELVEVWMLCEKHGFKLALLA